MLALSLVGCAIALYGVLALGRVHYALHHTKIPANSDGIASYLELRAILQRVLLVEGAIIGAAVLASGALRNAVVAFHDHDDSKFPRELVLVYGAYFTTLLALLYAPVYIRLLAVGSHIVDGICPSVDPRSTEWTDVYEKRKKLDELLELQVATSASFKAGIAIAAPLGSSIVGLLIGKA